MKVYIAGPFFNEEQIRIIESVEHALNQNGIKFFSPRSEGALKEMSREEQQASRSAIFQSNVDNMSVCTHMIACVETKDTGTLWEMGFMFAQSKPIVMMLSDVSRVNVMLAESAKIANSPSQAAGILLGIDYGNQVEELT